MHPEQPDPAPSDAHPAPLDEPILIVTDDRQIAFPARGLPSLWLALCILSALALLIALPMFAVIVSDIGRTALLLPGIPALAVPFFWMLFQATSDLYRLDLESRTLTRDQRFFGWHRRTTRSIDGATFTVDSEGRGGHRKQRPYHIALVTPTGDRLRVSSVALDGLEACNLVAADLAARTDLPFVPGVAHHAVVVRRPRDGRPASVTHRPHRRWSRGFALVWSTTLGIIVGVPAIAMWMVGLGG